MNHKTYPITLDLFLPWNADKVQEARFKAILILVSMLLLVFFMIAPYIPVLDTPNLKPERTTTTQLTLNPVTPIPEPKMLAPEVKPEPKPPKPKPIVVEKKSKIKNIELKKSPSTKKEAPAKKISKAPTPDKNKIPQALNNLAARLNKIHKSTNISALKRKNISQNTKGQVASVSKTVLGQENILKERQQDFAALASPIASNATLAAHKTTRLDGIIYTNNQNPNQDLKQPILQNQRNDESIRQVFESGKSQAYIQYQAALGNNPNLYPLRMVFRGGAACCLSPGTYK